jgi:Putative DNA-binding domain
MLLPEFPTPQQIIDVVRLGESENVEFKRRLPGDEFVARTLSAFANSTGGVLLVGIGDDGQIVGLSEFEAVDAYNRLLTISESILPSLARVGMTVVNGGRYVVHADVEEAPRYLKPVVTATAEAYQREMAGGERRIGLESFWTVPVASRRARTKTKPVDVFVAMSFRTEEEPALEDYYRAIERAAGKTDRPLRLQRIDLKEGDFEISQEIMDEISACQIVIADLTLTPSNVYFELGYARGQGKRIVQIARKGTNLEFDVRNWRTIFYRNATELEELLVPALVEAYYAIAKSG